MGNSSARIKEAAQAVEREVNDPNYRNGYGFGARIILGSPAGAMEGNGAEGELVQG